LDLQVLGALGEVFPTAVATSETWALLLEWEWIDIHHLSIVAAMKVLQERKDPLQFVGEGLEEETGAERQVAVWQLNNVSLW
jgi:hypothetical protein